MGSFPTREADIVALANDIATGLATHTEVFPAPPHGPEEIREALSAVTTAHEAAVVATAQARQGTATKDEAFDKLVDLMKTDLRYAENEHGFHTPTVTKKEPGLSDRARSADDTEHRPSSSSIVRGHNPPNGRISQ